MAIAPTGAIYKALTFDGVSSRSYGVYITGEAVYNAPERDVEMIAIPGRNGAFALDKGRFENIEVTYPAGIFADTETDFAQGISDFRNYLCSRKGYVRLTDEYNPNEYRMAVYKSGLEVSPAQLKAGEFEITFECKPQRWLTSGETATTVANNGTMTNPTLFESSPLLAVKGYGTIGFNGYTIKLENGQMGETMLWDKQVYDGLAVGTTITRTISSGVLNSGDAFTLEQLSYHLSASSTNTQSKLSTATATGTHSGISNAVAEATYRDISHKTFGNVFYSFTLTVPTIDFIYGTTKTVSDTATFNWSATWANGTTNSGSLSMTVSVSYDGSNTVSFACSDNTTQAVDQFTLPQGIGQSTVSLLGNPTYIDCDIGSAYLLKNGVPVSLNAYIDLGSNLPTLAPGTNTFTKTNTVTELKVTPRWWKV